MWWQVSRLAQVVGENRPSELERIERQAAQTIAHTAELSSLEVTDTPLRVLVISDEHQRAEFDGLYVEPGAGCRAQGC